MRIPLLCVALILSTAACDRRADPEMDPADRGTTSAPGERTATTPEAANDPYPASTEPSMPPATGGMPDDPAATQRPCASNDPNCVDPSTTPATDPVTDPATPPPVQPTE